MDDKPTNENPEKDFNKLDLSQLQSFSFGTQWSQDKPDTSGRPSNREPRRDDRPRRDGPPGAGPDQRRDRRGFRKPAGGPSDGQGAPEGGQRFREGSEHRGPNREPRGDQRGPRREGSGGYRDAGPRDMGPYISPFYTVTFYPEDTSFAALAKTIRASGRTFELFDIARTVIGKIDRFVVVVQHKTDEAGGSTDKPAGFSISVPDGLPFENDDAAINHVMVVHLAHFFDTSEVEVEAPKGNYQVINKCGITGDLLGPPNYHRYNQIIQQHHSSKVARMSFEAFRSRIESVRDPEVINQWLEQMKKVTRYTWKHGAEGEVPLTFDNLEDLRMYVLTQARDKVVKNVESARFPGKQLDLLPQGEIYRAIEGALERQRRFPLDTANALRGRLRREGFTIFKKGSKGVSYVCAVKRKFRVPGQTFADSIGNLITYIEEHPMTKASELPERLLGLPVPPRPSAAEGSSVSRPPMGEAEPKESNEPKPEAEAGADTEAAPSPAPVASSVPGPSAAPFLTPEEQQKLTRLQGDLRWLVMEGYVTEFMDGRLFAPPPMVEARKKEVESTEHDLENFPEAPELTTAPRQAAAVKPAPVAAESAPAESAEEPTEVPAEEPAAIPETPETPPTEEPAPVEASSPDERKPEPPAG